VETYTKSHQISKVYLIHNTLQQLSKFSKSRDAMIRQRHCSFVDKRAPHTWLRTGEKPCLLWITH